MAPRTFQGSCQGGLIQLTQWRPGTYARVALLVGEEGAMLHCDYQEPASWWEVLQGWHWITPRWEDRSGRWAPISRFRQSYHWDGGYLLAPEGIGGMPDGQAMLTMGPFVDRNPQPVMIRF